VLTLVFWYASDFSSFQLYFREANATNPGNTLYVTGLSSRVTDRDLEDHFSKEGKVSGISVFYSLPQLLFSTVGCFLLEKLYSNAVFLCRLLHVFLWWSHVPEFLVVLLLLQWIPMRMLNVVSSISINQF